MINVYGEDAPSYFTIKFWCKQLRWDGPRCGRPVEARTNENIKKVELLVLADRRIRVSMIADEIGISEAAVLKILHGDLGTNKVSPHWVSKLLNAEQNCVGYTFAKENFRALADDEELFSKIKNPYKRSPQPKSKNAECIRKVDGDDLLGNARNLTEKRPHNCNQKIMLLQDNCKVHKALQVHEVIAECGFVQMEHPPYSPDLAPSDYYLLPRLKKHLKGRRFSSNDYLKWIIIC
jgi:histone-lysine N-methyltransferase SETMAR